MIKLVLPLAGLQTFSGVSGFIDELEPVYDDYGLDEGRSGDDYAIQKMRVVPSTLWSKRAGSYPSNDLEDYEDDVYKNQDPYEIYDLPNSVYSDYENGRVDDHSRSKRSFGDWGNLNNFNWKRIKTGGGGLNMSRRRFGEENMKDFRESRSKSSSEVRSEIKSLKQELKDIKAMFQANKSIDKLLGISDVRQKMKERRAKRMMTKRKVSWEK